MPSHEWSLAEILLYCPANRPERFVKGLAASPQIIVDLEDSVAPADKDQARAAVRAVFEAGTLTADRVLVRVNGAGTAWHDRDVELCRQYAATVVLPKAESAHDLDALAELRVVAICETPVGVLRAVDIAAHPRVIALNWGGEDLTAALGGRASRRADGSYLQLVEYVRPHVLLACGAAGKLAIDGAYLAVNDAAGLLAETAEAALMGFGSKIALHPEQVAIIRQGFLPTPAQQEWAVELVAEAAKHPGVFSYRGRVVDEPLLTQARAMVRHSARQGEGQVPTA
jgi:citrate lyase subunit beta/citryl-CoA lyase